MVAAFATPLLLATLTPAASARLPLCPGNPLRPDRALCNENHQPTGNTRPGNNLAGTLPDSGADPRAGGLSTATRLARLDLRSNNLSSPLPDFYAQAAQLDLSNNSITGSVPLSLSSCQALSSLDLSHNQLSGTLDSGLGCFSCWHSRRHRCGRDLSCSGVHRPAEQPDAFSGTFPREEQL
eukprot:gene6705-6418_t